MQKTCRKPGYFFAAFGELGTDKLPVDSGCYIHEPGFISNSGISIGDVVLLYCTGSYPNPQWKAPGIGVVLKIDTGIPKEEFHYQYFPFDNLIDWEIIKISIPELKNCSNFSLIGNWLRKISGTSFKDTIKGRQINWP